jgi:hypothetical protein
LLGQLNRALREDRVPGREDQSTRREHTRAQRQQLGSHGLPRHLQLWRALRSCYRADVMSGEQISDGLNDRSGCNDPR